MRKNIFSGLVIALLLICAVTDASEYPEPKEQSLVLRNFKFNTGETIDELRLNYATIGDPSGKPALILHGTTGTWQSMMGKGFAGELFGPGQPLDATEYYIIIPDAIGTGKSSKPSDGLRGAFPRYNYDDMVDANYQMLKQMGIDKLRVIVGFSMGGMEAWTWAVRYPAFADAIVPMASMPTAMSSRNWITRRMMLDAVRTDPAWNNGFYESGDQLQEFRKASVFYNFATNLGNLNLQKLAPTRVAADELLDKALANLPNIDPNDFLYQWDASRDFDASPGIGKIQAHIFAINAADDERCPAETGLMEREIKRLANASYYLIPQSMDTAGHATTLNARFWKNQFAEFMNSVPRK